MPIVLASITRPDALDSWIEDSVSGEGPLRQAHGGAEAEQLRERTRLRIGGPCVWTRAMWALSRDGENSRITLILRLNSRAFDL
jgi:hypothetical protein